MIKIVQKDDPVLRQIAKPVPQEMFGTDTLRTILRDMSDAMNSQDDAVAIAAPQIGVSLRIFMVSGKVLDMLYQQATEGETDEEDSSADSDDSSPDMAFINPTIVKMSRDREEMEEGCLSVRYLYGKTRRAKKARVRAFDENGNVFEMGGSGLFAQIIQHEYDHLEGKLFIDIATDIEDLPPTKTRRKHKTQPPTP